MRALERVARPWREARRTWFDGTPESIEARLASTERVLTYARAGMTQAHMDLTREASAARSELLEAKHRLLNDFLDDGARAFKGSKRVADGDGKIDREQVRKCESGECGHDEPTEDGDDAWAEAHGNPHVPREASYPLGPGYERPGFGPEDIADYEDYLHQHDYHADDTDLNAMGHRLHPDAFDDDDPARYSYLRYADDSSTAPPPAPQQQTQVARRTAVFAGDDDNWPHGYPLPEGSSPIDNGDGTMTCPNCGYDEVKPNTSSTCPECDHYHENFLDDSDEAVGGFERAMERKYPILPEHGGPESGLWGGKWASHSWNHQ